MDEYPTEMFKFSGKNKTTLDKDIVGYQRTSLKVYRDHMWKDAELDKVENTEEGS